MRRGFPTLFATLFLCLFFAVPSHADTVAINCNVDFDNVEQFATSFNWDMGINQLVPQSLSYSSTGPLGFSFDTILINPFGGPGNALWRDQFGDGLQILFTAYDDTHDHLFLNTVDGGGGNLPLGMVDIFCSTTNPCVSKNDTQLVFASSGLLTVTPVPEPSPVLLTLAGLAAIALLWHFTKHPSPLQPLE